MDLRYSYLRAALPVIIISNPSGRFCKDSLHHLYQAFLNEVLDLTHLIQRRIKRTSCTFSNIPTSFSFTNIKFCHLFSRKNSDLPVLTWSIKCGKPLCKASIGILIIWLSGPFKNLRSSTLDCLFRIFFNLLSEHLLI